MRTKKNITITNISKRKVHLDDPSTDLFLTYDSVTDTVAVSLDDDEDEYASKFPREDFLEAVVQLFPENVAYQFPTEEDEE